MTTFFRIKTYLVVQLFLANNILLSSAIANIHARKAAQKRSHEHPCSLLKVHTSEEFCFLNIRHSNGTSIYSKEGIAYFEECYNESNACYSFEVGYFGNAEDGRCNFNVTLNKEILEMGHVKHTYFRIGEFSKSIFCKEKAELVLRPFYDDSLEYSHGVIESCDTTKHNTYCLVTKKYHTHITNIILP